MPPNLRRQFHHRRTPYLTATEPAGVFAVKTLLHPVISVACLIACLSYWGESVNGPYVLIAVLAFLASAELFDVAPANLHVGAIALLQSFIRIALRWALVLGFIWALLHISKLSDNFRFDLLATWALITPLALWSSETLTQRLIRSRNPAVSFRKAIIVGLTDTGLQLEHQLHQDPSLRIQVVGFFEDRHRNRLKSAGVERILGKPADVKEFVKRNQINITYVTLPMTHNPRITELLNSLRDSTVSIYFVPNLSAFELVQARLDVIGGMPVVAVCESPFYGARGIAKRFTDVIIALTVLIVLSPLILFVALGVKLSSSGPTLFKQRRYGLDGREIWIYKFRSMTVTEDGDTQYRQVIRNDTRVTRFGIFLRRLSLDELPQLINVLAGTLSIVGPRPHAIAVNEQYRKLIPGYMLRHKIKPGITGWAQVNGYRGGDDLESMRKRVEFDMDYLRHWSLILDLSIILRTAAIVLKDSRAY
jgi:putative colanic acid biosynthesis UDP-glucose lipid carrier transferase